jgi:hypothetical protein
MVSISTYRLTDDTLRPRNFAASAVFRNLFSNDIHPLLIFLSFYTIESHISQKKKLPLFTWLVKRNKIGASRDKERDRTLQSVGFPVFRFSGSGIYRQPLKSAEESLRFWKRRFTVKPPNFGGGPRSEGG